MIWAQTYTELDTNLRWFWCVFTWIRVQNLIGLGTNLHWFGCSFTQIWVHIYIDFGTSSANSATKFNRCGHGFIWVWVQTYIFAMIWARMYTELDADLHWFGHRFTLIWCIFTLTWVQNYTDLGADLHKFGYTFTWALVQIQQIS